MNSKQTGLQKALADLYTARKAFGYARFFPSDATLAARKTAKTK